MNPSHLGRCVLGLLIKFVATGAWFFSNWDEPKPTVPTSFDTKLSSFATVMTICSDEGQVFITQLMAFDTFPAQLQWLLYEPSVNIFCYGWDHTYLMIQNLFGGECPIKICGGWWGHGLP